MMKYIVMFVLAAAVPQQAVPNFGKIDIPTLQGSTGATVEIWDEDVGFDDHLANGEVDYGGETAQGGGTVPFDFDAYLWCDDDNHVTGDLESSWGITAEIYLVVTYEFPGGSTTTVTIDVGDLTCGDDVSPVLLNTGN